MAVGYVGVDDCAVLLLCEQPSLVALLVDDGVRVGSGWFWRWFVGQCRGGSGRIWSGAVAGQGSDDRREGHEEFSCQDPLL
eukprot:7439887-Ditylum_brightwellii.AAC.1